MSTENSEDLHCSHCEGQGEISFSQLQRDQLNIPSKLLIKNLPEGISESGIKNLFLSVGKPLFIEFNARKLTAVVNFKTLKEAELAIRDLNNTPPYHLKVISISPKNENTQGEKIKLPVESEREVELVKEVLVEKSLDLKSLPEILTEDVIATKKEREIQLQNRLKLLNYNPSIRFRQNVLDFKTELRCIALGRGYYNMGNDERYIGGLKKCIIDSKNSTIIELPHCEICYSSTSKKCKDCSKAFCSKYCTLKSDKNHITSCLNFENEITKSDLINKDLLENSSNVLVGDESFNVSDSDSSDEEIDLETCLLNSGDTVVITSYVDMKTIYIRSAEKYWEEKFFRVLDDVYYETLKGKLLNNPIQVGDIYSAKYYEDLNYYRARIMSVDENETYLLFIDFGNTQKTKLKDLKVLPEILKQIPGFAFKIELSDIPEGSSFEAVRYLNFLTAGEIPLIVKFEKLSEGVVLQEKDTNEIVNKSLAQFILPSWKKDESVLSKLGEVIFAEAVKLQQFTVGESYSLIVSHFNEKEFLKTEVFWAVNPEAFEYLHIHTELKTRISEYCEFLKDDCYLPRINEICLAKDRGEWYRCVTLDTIGTSCFLFFADEGHSASVETADIRKIIKDFVEVPFQAVCCVLPDKLGLKNCPERQSQVSNYFKSLKGRPIKSVRFNMYFGDVYCVSIPEIDEMLIEI